MHVGGVQKALVSLLWSIRGKYDVTLLLFYKGGEYLNSLPPEVKVMTAGGGWRYLGMTKDDVQTLPDKLGRAAFAAVSRLFGRRYAIALMSLGQKKLAGYDAVISYLHNSTDKAFYGGCNDFALLHTQSEQKITFLHCDYLHCGANTARNARQYQQFDVVAACSRGCADSFLEACPEMADKVMVVPNCHLAERIREDAKLAWMQLPQERINVVTVARLGKEKGVERALRAISRLGALKARLHYYVIGDGIQRPLLEKILEEERLTETVTLCGLQLNPYGYIQAADLLLIPSYSEAAPLVIGEAAILGTPVLSTETSSAREMIEKTGIGWVCENSEGGMQRALTDLLHHSDELRQRGQSLEKQDFNNETALRQFDRCMYLKTE